MSSRDTCVSAAAGPYLRAEALWPWESPHDSHSDVISSVGSSAREALSSLSVAAMMPPQERGTRQPHARAGKATTEARLMATKG